MWRDCHWILGCMRDYQIDVGYFSFGWLVRGKEMIWLVV
jgi:hypothetical protein